MLNTKHTHRHADGRHDGPSAAHDSPSAFPRLLHGFTLVELLVVIAIIGILVSLLLPAIQSAREAARRTQCSNNFKQVGLALLSYESAKKELPPGTLLWAEGCSKPPKPTYGGWGGFGWGAFILPHLEENATYDKLDFKKMITEQPNFAASMQFVGAFLCPSDPTGRELSTMTLQDHPGYLPEEDCANTNMAGVADSVNWTCDGRWPGLDRDGMLFSYSHVGFKNVTDGSSHTLLVGEIISAEPGTHDSMMWITWDTLHTANGINTAVHRRPSNLWSVSEMSFSSFHPGGCHFSMADGSVRWVNETINQSTLTALTTRAKGEVYAGNE